MRRLALTLLAGAAACGGAPPPPAAPADPAPTVKPRPAPQRDVDGDGYADFILGDRQLFLGSRGGTFVDKGDVGSREWYGETVIVGDMDGDGDAELAIGDSGCAVSRGDPPPCGEGSIRIVRGGTGNLTDVSDRLPGADQTARGMRIVPVGDVDHDGRADFAAPARDGIYVYLGAPAGQIGAPLVLPPGSEPIAAGDVDGDGDDDILTLGYGPASLWSLDRDGAFVATELPLANVGDTLYTSIGAGGDFDGDGLADLALTYGTLDGTQVIVHRSQPGITREDVTIIGAGPLDDGYGGALASVGDVDGDGRDDLVVASTCAVRDGFGSCTAWRFDLHLGGPDGLAREPVVRLEPARVNMAIPTLLEGGLGDVDGDGRADFALGAFVFLGAQGGVVSESPASL